MNESSALRAGRKAPFAQIAEWVIAAPVTTQAKALYMALAAHENHARGDGRVWPGLTSVAKMLGYKHRQSLSRYITELVELGAIEIEYETHAGGRRPVYIIHELPPDGYGDARSVVEFHAQLRAEEEGSNATAFGGSKPGSFGGSKPTGFTNHTNGTTRSEPDEGSPTGTCSRRSNPAGSSAKSKPKKPYVVLRGRDLVGLPAKEITRKVTAMWHAVLKQHGGEEPVSYGGGWREAPRDRHPVGSQIKDFFMAHGVDDYVHDEEWLDGLLRNVRAHAVQYAQNHPQQAAEAA
jgi:hypothetical protein